MIHLTDKDIDQEIEESPLPIGTRFWEEYDGLTMGGFGKVVKCWEIEEYLGDGLFSCKLIYSNSGPINPKYRGKFSIDEINDLIK